MGTETLSPVDPKRTYCAVLVVDMVVVDDGSAGKKLEQLSRLYM